MLDVLNRLKNFDTEVYIKTLLGNLRREFQVFKVCRIFVVLSTEDIMIKLFQKCGENGTVTCLMQAIYGG